MNLFNNLCEYLAYHAGMRGDLMMASDAQKALSYGEAWSFVEQIATALQSSGITKGDRVGMLAKNSVDNFCVFLACARIGAVAVGLNYRLSAEELDFIASDAQVRLLCFDSEFSDLRGEHLLAQDNICLDAPVENARSLGDWHGEAGEFSEVEARPDDILFHMYTSGTTGRPKGVLISHRNVMTNCYQAPLSSGVWARVGERVLIIAPNFHAVGLVGSLMGVMYGSSMLIQRDYDPLGMIETLASERINTVAVIPVMLQFSMMMVPNIKDYDFSHLHTINYGASPIPESLLKDCMETFGCDFVQGYGQTEATMALTFLTAADHRKALESEPELLRSCGRAVAGTLVKIIDDEGNEVPRGEIGEIVAHGPQIMQGYWNNAEATAKTVVDGWLHTGDAGLMDERGYLFIKDRVKDMIISGGENIYPVEIENHLMAHPQIEDVAVIGIPDEKWGEVPLAVLVAGEHDEISAAALEDYCRGKLAGFKIPRQREYIAGLPRNPSGKILKKDLRMLFSEKYGM